MRKEYYFQHLRQLIESCFDLEDLRALCFDLYVNYENLGGDRLSTQIVGLIEQMRKTGRMTHLLTELAKARPHIDWPVWQPASDTVVDPAPRFEPLSTLSIPNPFGKTGKVQDPDLYLVRQPLTDHIMHELRKRVSLSIVGPSQTGKSSLLWYITREAPTILNLPPEDFVYLSMELIHSEDDFFDYICSELKVEASRGFRLARKLRGRQIILCLDEIEKMTWDGFTLNVRTELRGLADGTRSPLTLVIASRSSLGQLFPDSPEMTSPLAGLCMQVNMPNFSLAEAKGLVAQYLRGSDVVFPDDEIKKVWLETSGHPFRIQQALQIIYAQTVNQGDSDER